MVFIPLKNFSVIHIRTSLAKKNQNECRRFGGMELNQTALFPVKGFQTFYWLSINLSDDRRTTSGLCMMKKHL